MSSNKTPRMIQCELPSSLAGFHGFIEQVLEALAEHHWKKEDLFAVHMALEESISNAIRHGNKEDLTKKVRIECKLSSDRFWIQICDEGEGYDPSTVPDCCAEENLESSGGRGLALICAYMNSVEHSECGKCLTMEKTPKSAKGPATSDA